MGNSNSITISSSSSSSSDDCFMIDEGDFILSNILTKQIFTCKNPLISGSQPSSSPSFKGGFGCKIERLSSNNNNKSSIHPYYSKNSSTNFILDNPPLPTSPTSLSFITRRPIKPFKCFIKKNTLLYGDNNLFWECQFLKFTCNFFQKSILFSLLPLLFHLKLEILFFWISFYFPQENDRISNRFRFVEYFSQNTIF